MLKRKAKSLALSKIIKKAKSLDKISENSSTKESHYSSLIDIREMPNQNQAQPNPQTSTQSIYSANMQEIFNSLRIPDVVKDLPNFDGNPRLLYDFITNVEEILMFLKGTEHTPYGQIILRAIRNKITGTANELLNTYLTRLDWTEIKQNLISAFADKRTETTLIRDLHNIRQSDRSLEQFHADILEIQAALLNNVLINEKDQKVINSKRELFSEMCLNAFLTGLKEPLGATIRAMRPDNLSTALAYCVKEQNITTSKQVIRPYKPYQPRQIPFYNQYYQNFQNKIQGQNYRQFNTQQQREFNRPQYYTNRYYNTNNQIQERNPFARNAIMPPKAEPVDNNTTRTNFRPSTSYSHNKTNMTGRNFEHRINPNSNFHNINQSVENYLSQGTESIVNIDDTVNFQASASKTPQGT